jgi:uncharacterized protein (TIGR02588 family)
MSRKKGKSQIAPRTKAEWVSLVIAVLLLAAVIGLVVALWMSPARNPARFRVDRGAIRSEAGLYYLQITVINEGDATGAQVSVEGKLTSATGDETSSTTFDFIPARSRAEGTLIFSRDPAAAEVRVASFQQP